jgi:superfamily II DNA helicase RecQ
MKSRVFSLVLSGEQRSREEKSLNSFLRQVEVKNIFASIVDERLPLWSILIFYEGEAGGEGRSEGKAEPAEEIILTEEEQQLYEKLREWRWEKAKEENVPGYIIARNVSLKLLAKSEIDTEEDLLTIRGIGPGLAGKYGADILEVLKQFRGSNDAACRKNIPVPA